MKRTICEKRFLDRKSIKRKEEILKNVYRCNKETLLKLKGNYLSKNKIHCSCPMCTKKTNIIGWKHSDLIKIQKLQCNVPV